jgi:hypothetical protein
MNKVYKRAMSDLLKNFATAGRELVRNKDTEETALVAIGMVSLFNTLKDLCFTLPQLTLKDAERELDGFLTDIEQVESDYDVDDESLASAKLTETGSVLFAVKKGKYEA